jgi:hypothetical protein
MASSIYSYVASSSWNWQIISMKFILLGESSSFGDIHPLGEVLDMENTTVSSLF